MEPKASFWDLFSAAGRLDRQWAAALALDEPAARAAALRRVCEVFERRPAALASRWPSFLATCLDARYKSALLEGDLGTLASVSDTVATAASDISPIADSWLAIADEYQARGLSREAAGLRVRLAQRTDCPSEVGAQCATWLAARELVAPEHLDVYAAYLKSRKPIAPSDPVRLLVDRECAVDFDSTPQRIGRAVALAARFTRSNRTVAGADVALGIQALLVAGKPIEAGERFTAALDIDRANRVAQRGLVAAAIQAGQAVASLADRLPQTARQDDPVVDGLFRLAEARAWLDGAEPGPPPATATSLEQAALRPYAPKVFAWVTGRLHLIEGQAASAAAQLIPLAANDSANAECAYHACWAAALTGQPAAIGDHFAGLKDDKARWTIGLLLLETDDELARKRGVRNALGSLPKPVGPLVRARLALMQGDTAPEFPWKRGKRNPVEDLEALRTRLAMSIVADDAAAVGEALQSPEYARLPRADRLYWEGVALWRAEPGRSRALLEEAAVRLGYHRAAIVLAVVDLERRRPEEATRWLALVPEAGRKRVDMLRACADAQSGREEAAIERLERLSGEKREGAWAWQLLAQLYLRRADTADEAGNGERATLDRKLASGALARARQAGSWAAGSDGEILATCVTFALDPGAAAVCAQTWPLVRQLPRARRRAWVAWHAAAAYLAGPDPADPVPAADELVTVLEDAGTPNAAAVSAVAGLIARAGIRTSDLRAGDDLCALLLRLRARWPLPPVADAFQATFAAAARRHLDVRTDSDADGAVQNLVRLARSDGGNVPLALLAASRLIDGGQRAQAGDLLRGVAASDADEARILAAVLAGEGVAPTKVVAVDRTSRAVPPAVLHMLGAAAAAVDGRVDDACHGILAAIGNPAAAAIVNPGRLLPTLAAHAARTGLAPESLRAVVQQMASQADASARLVLARYAAALGDAGTALELWEQALAGDADPLRAERREYDAYAAHLAVVAYRRGDLEEAVSYLRRPSMLQERLESANEADFQRFMREARAAEAAGEWAVARTAYGQAARLKPSDEDAARGLTLRVVDAASPDCYATVGAAIEAADPGDRILITPGTYSEALVLDKPLIVAGHGTPGEVVIETSGADCILTRAAHGRVANLALRQIGGGSWYGVDVAGGGLEICDCDITSASLACIGIHGEARPEVRRNRIHDSASLGILVYDGAGGVIEDNDIEGNAASGIGIRTGADPIVRRNRIRDGKLAGVLIEERGRGTFEDNEIAANALSGMEVRGGSSPVIRRNRFVSGKSGALFVHGEATGVFEDNDISDSGMCGIQVSERASPVVRRNRIHDGKSAGAFIMNGGEGVFEENEFYGNTSANVQIQDGSTPHIRKNVIRDGGAAGVYVRGPATPVIEDNAIFGNAGAGIWIGNGAEPIVRRNAVHDGKSAGVLVEEGGRAIFEDNEFAANTLAGMEVRGGSNPVIRRNRFVSGIAAGLFVHGGATGVVEDNEISGNKGCAMQVSQKANPTVTHNRIHDGKSSGVFVTDGGEGVFEENEFWGQANSALVVSEDGNPAVRHNHMHDNSGGAVFVFARGRGTFEHNRMIKNHAAAVEVREGGDPAVRHNTIAEGQGPGVFVYKDGRGTFEDNDIRGNKLAGVEVREAGAPVVRNNRIADNGGSGVFVHSEGAGVFEDNTSTGNARPDQLPPAPPPDAPGHIPLVKLVEAVPIRPLVIEEPLTPKEFEQLLRSRKPPQR